MPRPRSTFLARLRFGGLSQTFQHFKSAFLRQRQDQHQGQHAAPSEDINSLHIVISDEEIEVPLEYGPATLHAARLAAAFGAHSMQVATNHGWFGVRDDATFITFGDKASLSANREYALNAAELSPEQTELLQRGRGDDEQLRDYRCYHCFRYRIQPPEQESISINGFEYDVELLVVLENGYVSVRTKGSQPNYQLPFDWPALMARGLYKMGEDALLAELEEQFGPQLSFHDKSACREEMPRELWPESWENIR